MRPMRLPLIGFALTVLASAQSPDLHLRGDRFAPLTYDGLTPEQKTMADNLLSGERKGMNGPFNALLRSPQIGDAAQKFGAQVRFHSSLPNRLNEFAILITARFWNAQYEWSAHRKLALTAGLKPAIIETLGEGRKPVAMQADEEVIFNFADELLKTRQVSDAAFKAVVDKFGERGAVDLTAVLGYYCFVSMILNVDRYPLPDGEKPGLKPLR
jgi:4-carboxymuconolactone decarboxylase